MTQLGMSVADSRVMRIRRAVAIFDALLCDQRGAVATEYLVVTAVMLAVSVALALLGPALFVAGERAQVYLQSDSP